MLLLLLLSYNLSPSLPTSPSSCTMSRVPYSPEIIIKGVKLFRLRSQGEVAKLDGMGYSLAHLIVGKDHLTL